jgi:two-component system alkaline phosphatase synthesis response regulator PhoP
MMSNNNVTVHEMDILIVEDDNMLNHVMSLQLQVAGYSVRSARSGTQALKMIKDRVPSVLILDVGLPDMSGQDLIAELRQNPATYSLPLIVHTTLDLSEEEKTQMQLGPSRFVTKATAFSDRLGELITEVTE